MTNYIYGIATTFCLWTVLDMINSNIQGTVWQYTVDFARYVVSVV